MEGHHKRAKEPFPLFKTFEECLEYSHAKQDRFYVTAFMIEAWIGQIICLTVSEYAELKSGNPHLQTGIGWDAWELVFGQAKVPEWIPILEDLTRFAQCDTRESDYLLRVFGFMAAEDKEAEPVSPWKMVERAKGAEVAVADQIKQMRFLFRRMSQWMEALIHWKTHLMYAVAPIVFQATEEKRQLASIGMTQRGYASLSKHGKEWWHFRHEELARQFGKTPDWGIVGKVQSNEKWGSLKHPGVDELTIHWWPLLLRYKWTDRDMKEMLRRVLPERDLYPLGEDKEFADYRKKALGLVKGKGASERDKSAPDGRPAGWRAALSMIDRLSE